MSDPYAFATIPSDDSIDISTGIGTISDPIE